MLDKEKSNNLELRSNVQELENTVGSLENALEVERRRALDGVEHERGTARQLKSDLSTTQVRILYVKSLLHIETSQI